MPRGDDAGLIVAGNASVDLLLGPVAPWPVVGTEAFVERIAWRLGGALGNTALALPAWASTPSWYGTSATTRCGPWLRRRRPPRPHARPRARRRR